MRGLWLWLLLFILLARSSPGWAQTPSPASNPQALTLAAQAVQAMTGGQSLQDATLTGTVVWMAGLEIETGTATLESRGFWQSSLSFSLANGPWTEVRDSSSGPPAGTWSGADGVQHAMAEHNCWTDPNWFFPSLSSLAAALSDPTVALSYIGPETHNGLAVQHLRAIRYFANMDAASLSLYQTLSTIDIYLDSSSLVPDFIDFNAHSDTDENSNFPVEIRFANYQRVNGFVVPFRIQKLFNGTLLLDVTLSAAAVNTGLPATNF
jgi:hypothetical protein